LCDKKALPKTASISSHIAEEDFLGRRIILPDDEKAKVTKKEVQPMMTMVDKNAAAETSFLSLAVCI